MYVYKSQVRCNLSRRHSTQLQGPEHTLYCRIEHTPFGEYRAFLLFLSPKGYLAGMNLSGIASQFAMQNRSFAMRNGMWFAENCDAKRSRPRKKNVVCMRFPCVHECMHLRTVFQCAIKDLRLYAISFYLSRGTRFVLLSAYAIRLSFPWFSCAPFW